MKKINNQPVTHSPGNKNSKSVVKKVIPTPARITLKRSELVTQLTPKATTGGARYSSTKLDTYQRSEIEV